MKRATRSFVTLCVVSLVAVLGCDDGPTSAAPPVDVAKAETPVTPTGITGSVTRKIPEDSGTRMARRLAEKSDALWDKKPEAGMANLRFLLKVEGKPLAGKLDIVTDFRVVINAANRGGTHSQGFNPNQNGRFVYTQLEPGTYDVDVESVGGEYTNWTRHGARVVAGDALLFEVDLVASK
jgi:hypothetical protein